MTFVWILRRKQKTNVAEGLLPGRWKRVNEKFTVKGRAVEESADWFNR